MNGSDQLNTNKNFPPCSVGNLNGNVPFGSSCSRGDKVPLIEEAISSNVLRRLTARMSQGDRGRPISQHNG